MRIFCCSPLRNIFYILSLVGSISCYSQEINQLHSKLKLTTDPSEKAEILGDIGYEYFKGQIYLDSAIYYTEKSLELSKENEYHLGKLRGLFNLGSINNFLGKREEAIEWYQEFVELDCPEKSVLQQSGAYNNIGGVYFHLEQYDNAIENYQKAMEINKMINDTLNMGVSYLNVGEAYYKLDSLDLSKKNIEKAVDYIKRYTDYSTLHLFYSRTLFALNDIKKAKNEAFKALELSKIEKDLNYTSEANLLISQIFEKEKIFDQAYAYHKEYVLLEDSLNTAKELNEIEKLRLNFQLKEKDEKLEYLSQKQKDRNIIRILSIAGIVLLLLLIFRQFKFIKMTNNIHDIQKRLIESELLLREEKHNAQSQSENLNLDE